MELSHLSLPWWKAAPIIINSQINNSGPGRRPRSRDSVSAWKEFFGESRIRAVENLIAPQDWDKAMHAGLVRGPGPSGPEFANQEVLF